MKSALMLVLGLSAGLAGGVFGIAPILAETDAGSTTDGALTSGSGNMNRDVGAAEAEVKDATRGADSDSDQSASENAAGSSVISEDSTEIEALAARIETQDVEIERLMGLIDEAILEGFDPGIEFYSEEEIAKRRERAKVLLGDIQSALESKDKDTIIEAMRDLDKLGSAAAEQFFEAYEAVRATGRPGWNGQGNSLGMTFQEYVGLMGNNMREYAMKANPGAVPETAQITAVRSMPWLGEIPRDKRLGMMEDLLRRSTNDTLNSTIVQSAAQIRSEEAGLMLSRAATNGALATDVRVSAITSSASMGDDADWATIETLSNDSDPKVSEAAKNALSQRSAQSRLVSLRSNPPVAGYLVETVTNESNAARAGLRVGDIITRYNYQAISSGAALGQALGAASQSGLQQISIDVLRGGSTQTMTISAGQMGVRGSFVSP